MKKVKLVLYKDSDCNLCKLQQEELINNPPEGEVIIKHIKHPDTAKETKDLGISDYPCIIIIDTDTNKPIHRIYGFTSTEIINLIIKSL